MIEKLNKNYLIKLHKETNYKLTEDEVNKILIDKINEIITEIDNINTDIKELFQWKKNVKDSKKVDDLLKISLSELNEMSMRDETYKIPDNIKENIEKQKPKDWKKLLEEANVISERIQKKYKNNNEIWNDIDVITGLFFNIISLMEKEIELLKKRWNDVNIEFNYLLDRNNNLGEENQQLKQENEKLKNKQIKIDDKLIETFHISYIEKFERLLRQLNIKE